MVINSNNARKNMFPISNVSQLVMVTTNEAISNGADLAIFH